MDELDEGLYDDMDELDEGLYDEVDELERCRELAVFLVFSHILDAPLFIEFPKFVKLCCKSSKENPPLK
jgi:hypothetical protein